MSVATEWDQMWLPLWPLASDDLVQGVYRTSRREAMGRRYVETNPHALSNLLVVDIDHPDAALRALSAAHHPMPTAVVENAANGHAHAVWALSEPVTRTEYARRKPLAFAAAVTEGLRRAVDGDQGYSGLITKNPAHDAWQTHWMGAQLRSLDELAQGLESHMPPPRWREAKKHRGDVVGLGRNCALFESARVWAYREARKLRLRHEYATAEDSRILLAVIETEINARNAEYPEPLPQSETRAIAASIHRWITTKFYGWTDARTVNQATFTAMQSARARKRSEQRRARSEEIARAL